MIYLAFVVLFVILVLLAIPAQLFLNDLYRPKKPPRESDDERLPSYWKEY